ncbi:hypothetical protein GCM10009525_29360 [Streptosporangium amethystogenes subsp. fukuiense]
MQRFVWVVGCLTGAGCSVLPGAGPEQAPPTTATAYPCYALRTADGGALAFATIERSRRYDVRQGPERNYVNLKDNGLLTGKYYTYMKLTELIQVVATRWAPRPAWPILGRGSLLRTLGGTGRPRRNRRNPAPGSAVQA